ncbi:16S rRNA (cytosine(967)-C(5))-methyltransferase RsmB [Acetivibrio cellulolyticus]|uniref:16S rRNA (cytosine(967)-C(5))-methyltransferase RsmB n=1 Tax=Acetivibrio cellulolyticus TaxID=35830 RepID=UPI0001E2D8D9|nr:16S rRNA (cytosine(967)-C(5))-methyltransferase RsmB [Acetivibrio cellulolyticus]
MKLDLPRETALKILYDINKSGAYSNIALNKYLEDKALSGLDKAFITELVYGTLKWRLSIDYIIDQFSSVKINKLSPWILNILRLGVYQIVYMSKIPESAACNESVNLAKRYGHSASSRYVNAMLRNVARSKNKIVYPDRNKDLISYLSIKYSHPDWMVKKWLDRFGESFTEELLKSNNETAPLTVRVNSLKTTREELENTLKKEGFETESAKYIENALTINNPSSLTKMEAFVKGFFQVQDESSMMVGRIFDPKPGEFIVDVCSAPGGKTTHIAELMGNRGQIIARDIHEHKIRLINEASSRLGIDIIKAEIFDASEQDASLTDKADRVLVDAPCTGLGIIRRKPDIKWARNSNDLNEIVKLQEKILNASSKYVKPGGVLVYSTCTIEPQENEEMVKKFLKDNKEYTMEDISKQLPDGLVKDTTKDGYIQLYTNRDGIDGFFISKMRKRS